MKLMIMSIPPKGINEEIKRKIKKINKSWNNKAARCEPHLTLSEGFDISKKELSEISNKLIKGFKKIKKPRVKLKGWKTFSLSDCLGIHIEVINKKQVSNLFNFIKKSGKEYKKWYRINKFDPHISLAWNMKNKKSKEMLRKAALLLKKENFAFSKEYPLNKLYIYEKSNKKLRRVKILK